MPPLLLYASHVQPCTHQHCTRHRAHDQLASLFNAFRATAARRESPANTRVAARYRSSACARAPRASSSSALHRYAAVSATGATCGRAAITASNSASARLALRPSRHPREPHPDHRVGRRQRARAAQLRRGRRQVAALERPPARQADAIGFARLRDPARATGPARACAPTRSGSPSGTGAAVAAR